MITFRKVREDDLELNSKIEDLNIKVFPSTETTSDLHFLENYYKGASVDFIAIEDDGKFMGYTYMINFFPRLFYLLSGHRTRVPEIKVMELPY